ncbi:MAG TPA: hypothetical protein VNX22_00210 [Acidobacteriaceae bacterium]|jgi:hypothetical protein|nr:hypothetical protein [Acidobacteriaceae bacterium]
MPDAEMNPTTSNRAELLERLTVLEQMVNEGRRSTEKWGWIFILWGIAPLTALYWQIHWPHPDWSWPVMMTLAAAITATVSSRQHGHDPKRDTAVHRALSSVWAVSGSSIFLYILVAVLSHHYNDLRAFLATLFILLAIPNTVSAAVLRWRTQYLVSGMWWCAVVLAFFAPMSWEVPIYVTALLLGNVAFGIYLSIIERRSSEKGYARA